MTQNMKGWRQENSEEKLVQCWRKSAIRDIASRKQEPGRYTMTFFSASKDEVKLELHSRKSNQFSQDIHYFFYVFSMIVLFSCSTFSSVLADSQFKENNEYVSNILRKAYRMVMYSDKTDRIIDVLDNNFALLIIFNESDSYISSIVASELKFVGKFSSFLTIEQIIKPVDTLKKNYLVFLQKSQSNEISTFFPKNPDISEIILDLSENTKFNECTIRKFESINDNSMFFVTIIGNEFQNIHTCVYQSVLNAFGVKADDMDLIYENPISVVYVIYALNHCKTKHTMVTNSCIQNVLKKM